MRYDDIDDQLILNYATLKIAIYEEIKFLYQDRPYILGTWKNHAYHMTQKEIILQKPVEEMRSFGVLVSLFTEAFFHKKLITKQMVREVIASSGEAIKGNLTAHLYQEFPEYEVKYSVNEEKIEEVLENDYILSSTDMDFYLMRDMVTKKKEFKEGETGFLATEIIDNRGNVKGVAELRPHELQTTMTSEQDIWLETLGETLNSLDDLTADLFDLISYLWLTSPKSSDGYIEFHSDDALRLRNIKKKTWAGKEVAYREEDRFNIMRRVAALSSIWVSLGDKTVKIVNTEGLEENELYEFKDFKRMFEIGEIRVAYDKRSGEAKGIYAVQVRPTSILTPYLEGPRRTLGILDLKVFHYSHANQRAHKRLTRYLNLQWRIRTVKNNLQQPFKVSTLLKEMDFSNRYTGIALRDKFENTLDDLQADGVIKKWQYIDGMDEKQVGKRNWIKNYWAKLNVYIAPAEHVIKENKKFISYSQPLHTSKRKMEFMEEPAKKMVSAPIDAPKKQVHESVKEAHPAVFEQQSLELNDISLTPEIMKEALEKLDMSIRQAAKEIGFAHTTLSRYINGENKRQNKRNDDKMKEWLQQKMQR
ncbi:helix-turn-helix domain-containing protein [Niallia nealsonii]|uniref:HTH cro/C1-type domain-containing protein n=1 Tax=Niallia nealsonii TaxID=115979 RepID=A0A2N0Z6V7_9BACI|nr:helix-turn-helix domain-containing protein [Niallia nealsonii]PKG25255.1 hypothetical protein CWS01_02565 [Niallia nealsonii]